MCNQSYPLDVLIDLRYNTTSFADIREGMLIRLNQLKEQMKEQPLYGKKDHIKDNGIFD